MTYVLGTWREFWPGINHAHGIADCAFGWPVAREQIVNVMRIDLQTPGLSFITTQSGGQYSTVNERIFDFLTTNPSVRLAINGALAAAVGGQDGDDAALFGLAKSEGQLVCDPTKPVNQPQPTEEADVPDSTYTGAAVLTITKDNQASFQIITQAQPGTPPGDDVWTALAGSPQPWNQTPAWPPVHFVEGLQPNQVMVLVGGQNQGIPSADGVGSGGHAELIAARTAVGLSQDKRYLFLLTIDGVEGADPQYGASFHDVGQWLLLAGAYEGMTVDGGGSTAMAMVNQRGESVLVNVPHDGESVSHPYQQRSNAQFFGVIVPSES
jgi:Phosphodiester glycosidase